NQNFNDTPPFDTTNPSAELIAKHIADELASRLDDALAPNAQVHSVSITEAPGCIATYTR
ncbi:MAG TPA: 6-carboxytetrahydropterin synthase QueD, partial [Phycisphaerales bacterium]|nr:6-carboxytetrahydropterin synthase QueD [Phycisphaerales bacterium]